MKISSFDWRDDIVDKLTWKHHVSMDEVEEVFANRPLRLFVEKGERPGEDVYSVLGTTDSGRYLTVFFIHKRGGEAMPISARDMVLKERKRYEKK